MIDFRAHAFKMVDSCNDDREVQHNKWKVKKRKHDLNTDIWKSGMFSKIWIEFRLTIDIISVSQTYFPAM